jgi:hypothetical protein
MRWSSRLGDPRSARRCEAQIEGFTPLSGTLLARPLPQCNADGIASKSHVEDESFLGGYFLPASTWRGPRSTWPFVRLSLLVDSLRLDASVAFLKDYVPVWECAYGNVLGIQAIGRPPFVMPPGIRVHKESTGFDVVIFWTTNRRTILRSLRKRGLEMSFEPIRFRDWDPVS